MLFIKKTKKKGVSFRKVSEKLTWGRERGGGERERERERER